MNDDLIEHGERLLAESMNHPARAEARTVPPSGATIPGLLTALSHTMTEDARAELARVQPARWRLRVHQQDEEAWASAVAQGAAPDKGDDDELAGYVCVQSAVPVAHCRPDLLSWLRARGHTGPLILEWLPPKGPILRHFVYIDEAPEAAPARPSAPVTRQPAATGGQEFVERILEMQRAEMAELRDLVRETQATQERVIERMREQHQRALEDVRSAYAEQLDSDPFRAVGKTMHQRALERMAKSVDDDADPIDKLVGQFQKLEQTRQKLAAIADPEARAAVNPLEEKIGNALTDLAVMWGKQKMGLPVVGADQAVNLTRQLAELNREGASLLDSIEDEAA